MERQTGPTVRGLVLLLALGAGSCMDGGQSDSAAVDEQGSAIVNGTVTTARPEVGFLVNSIYGHRCTATLISQTTIVTAAHCISPDSDPGHNLSATFSVPPGFQLKGSVANPQTTPPQIYFRIDTGGACSSSCPGAPDCSGTIDHTCCDREFGANGTCAQDFAVDRLQNYGSQLGLNDMAVGHLTEAVSIASAASISASPPSSIKPTNLTAIGYGCISRSSSDLGIKRFLTYFYNGQDTQNYCPGDSGGPTFVGNLFDGGPLEVITSGFNSSGNDIGADPTGYKIALTSLASAMSAGGLSYRGEFNSVGFGATAASNGNQAAASFSSYRVAGNFQNMEGIQVWSSESNVVPMYRAYIQNGGWQPWTSDGYLAGTVGQNLRMEAFEMFLSNPGRFSDVRYQVHVHGDSGPQAAVLGNQSCARNSDCPTNLCAPDGFCAVGTTGQSRAIDTIFIQPF